MARILIADDANFMRVTLSKILQQNDHEIVGQAENGQEAIDLYQSLKPDLVTMDITMPVKNGIDAIQEIRAFDASATIVVCSAMGQQKVVVQAIEFGATDFIIKPFDKNRVVETIEKALKR